MFAESASDDTVAPAFLKKLESQIVDEQDLVIMECDIIGSPQPIITWYWEGKVLQEGDRFSSSYDGRVARLIMKRATKGDNGKYELVAQSSAGRISCDCLLVVKGLCYLMMMCPFVKNVYDGSLWVESEIVADNILMCFFFFFLFIFFREDKTWHYM